MPPSPPANQDRTDTGGILKDPQFSNVYSRSGKTAGQKKPVSYTNKV